MIIGFPKVKLTNDIITGTAFGKVTLPSITSRTKDTVAVEELLKACAPATFGKKGEEVLDESYRKAVKLDSDQFCTSFNPHEVGIVDAIAQSMLPAIAKPFSDQNSKHEENLGVIAELYKLNVSASRLRRGWSTLHRVQISTFGRPSRRHKTYLDVSEDSFTLDNEHG